MIRLFFLTLVAMTLFASCASRKDFIYLQSNENTEFVNQKHDIAPKLQTGDIITVSVTADDVRATQPFNPISSYATTGVLQDNSPFLPTYTIDSKGDIDFPKLGKIKLAGKTRLEAIEFLRKEIGAYIVNPGINIEIRNFRITILGEVKNPGIYPITVDRITLLEALGMAGDLTINGVRNNILVIRERDGVKEEYRVDLTSKETLNLPVYYLQQNDVVYVEPNKARVQSSKYTQNTSVFVSIAGVVIGIITLIVSNQK